MTTRLDPDRPILWRTPHSLQVGVDDAVVLDSVRTDTEQVVAALRAGFPALVERRLPEAFDIPAAEFERVLSTLDPVIAHDAATSGPTVAQRVLVDGVSPSAELLRRLLVEQEAVDLLPAETGSSEPGTQPGQVDVAVLFADFVVPPSRYTRWLRDDVPHLPVVFSDRSVRIGPFVTPGGGPCLHCVELHRADADPAWPAVASQLLGRRSPLDTLLLRSEVATRVARLLLRRLEASQPVLANTQLVIDAASGGVRRRVVREHSRCACRALPGIATAPDAPRVAASRTRTG
jgi:bacteriocin biosynthesis cyclodehydratase domain-containing protein